MSPVLRTVIIFLKPIHKMLNREDLKAIGESILLAALQFAIGSVEMSSKFSILNFTKDQPTLNNAVYSLRSYVIIGVIWMIGNIMLLTGMDGFLGGASAFIFNAIVLVWIVGSYYIAFKSVAKKYNLKLPNFWEKWNP